MGQWGESLHVFNGSLQTLAYRLSTICWHCRPEPMLNRICYMTWLATLLVHSCYGTLNDERVEASSVSSQICEGELVVIQVWSTLPGRFVTPRCAMCKRPVCNRSCPKFEDAFATVVPYTKLKLIQDSWRMSPLCNRVHSIMTNFYRNQEALRPDVAPADRHLDDVLLRSTPSKKFIFLLFPFFSFCRWR